MQDKADIQVGQVVKSRAGRDKGKVFLVVEILDDSHVFVADGKVRKLEKPKKKKMKHLAKYNQVVGAFKDLDIHANTANAAIRKMLEPYL